MSETDFNPELDDREQFVEVICTRGTVVKPGVTVAPGDVFSVPVKNQHEGVLPLRWWVTTKKAARNEDEFALFTRGAYNGRQGGPGTETGVEDVDVVDPSQDD